MIAFQFIKIVKYTRSGMEIVYATPASMLNEVMQAIVKKNAEPRPLGYDVLYSYILEDPVMMYEFDEEINL